MVLLFIVNLLLVKPAVKELYEEVTEENVVALTTEEEQEKQKTESSEESKPFYVLKSPLTAMWLPAVVGHKRNMFISASLSTLITKILMLVVSVILVYFFQEKVHSHPFVLWSKVGKSPNLLLANQVPILLLFNSAPQF